MAEWQPRFASEATDPTDWTDQERSFYAEGFNDSRRFRARRDGHTLGPAPADRVGSYVADYSAVELPEAPKEVTELFARSKSIARPAPAEAEGCVPVKRWWLEHVAKCLEGDLPSGRIGDCVFLLRDQIKDMLAATPSPQTGVAPIRNPKSE